ncbi:MAG: hypothetical protein HY978_00335 [Candidatus Liptonbacteria bacterium]|nr:hypothetical protein [Candidatus Liptonbacteria bacterium]
MKIFYIVSLLIVAIVVVGYLLVRNRGGAKSIEVAGMKDFRCQGISGFSFRYPVFKNWKAGEFEKNGQYSCKMFFDNPPGISYEVARQVGVNIMPRTGGGSGGVNKNSLAGTEKNKNGVNYQRLENSFSEFPSVYEFYDGDYDVQVGIIAGAEKDGFSERIFWQAVIDSFIFSQ